MTSYIFKRLCLIPLTLFGIILVNFIFIQMAPGGPVETVIAKMQGDLDATSKFSGSKSGAAENSKNNSLNVKISSKYRGAQGLDPEFIKELEQQFGFDKPAHIRFLKMLKDYTSFNFGNSFYKDQSVTNLIISKMPVSVSLGLWSTLIIYLISIPLGIKKAVKDGSKFDVITSWGLVIGYAIPGFLFAIFLIIIFAGGRYFDLFPLRGLISDNWDELSNIDKVTDYLWHLTLPVITLSIGAMASLTMLTKNSFIEEINKQYVTTAKAKGASLNRILYKHIFRNAMLIVIAGFPSTLINMLFTGSVLIEVIFSLDGIGLLGFESIMNRDYPVIFGTLFIFGLLGLLLSLISDITYHLIDPRIDFSKRGAK